MSLSRFNNWPKLRMHALRYTEINTYMSAEKTLYSTPAFWSRIFLFRTFSVPYYIWAQMQNNIFK